MGQTWLQLNVHLWFQEGGMMPNMVDVFFFPHLKEYLPEEIT